MSLSVGLTGGIGSGKSTVGEVFLRLGVPLYLSDQRGRFLLANDEEVQSAVRDTFGDSVFTNGKPDRNQLAKKVFADADGLAQLNGIIHPAVGRDFKQWHLQQTAPYVLKESAILIENGLHIHSDQLILVSAPEELRLRRVMDRDAISESEVLARMANQWPEEQKLPLADFLIVNNDQQLVIPQVLKVHEGLLAKAQA